MKGVLAVLASLVVVVAAGGQEKEAEKLFEEALSRLEKAKTLKIVFKGKAEVPEKDNFSAAGEIWVGEGERYRLSATMKREDESDTILVVSDGKVALSQFRKRAGKREAAKVGLGRYLRGIVGRVGVLVGFFQIRPELRDPAVKPDAAKDFPASDFRLGKEAMVDGRKVKELKYTLGPDEGKERYQVELLLDAKTLLPVRRTVTISKGDFKVDLVESYEVTLDPKIQAETFVLPKEREEKE